MALLHQNRYLKNKTAVEIPQENFPFNSHVQKVILITSGPSISIIRFLRSFGIKRCIDFRSQSTLYERAN
jgi:hypothetical protein